MRTYEEVGKLKDMSDEVNKAYRIYASIYQDFVDYNMNHFI